VAKNMLAQSTYNFPLNFYDRPALVISNIQQGNYDASIKSIFQPASLSPEERKTIGSRYGDNPAIKAMLDIVTNPLVILGSVLAMRYPILPAASVFNFARTAKGAASGLSWFGKNLGTPMRIFAEFPKVWKTLFDGSNKTHAFMQNYIGKMNQTLETFVGKAGSLPTREERAIMSLMNRGADKAGGGSLHKLFGAVREGTQVNLANDALLDLNALKAAGFAPHRISAMKSMASSTRNIYDEIGRVFFKTPGAAEDLQRALQNRYFFVGDVPIAAPHGVISKGTKKTAQLGGFLTDYSPQYMKGPRTLVQEVPEMAEYYAKQGKMATPFDTSFLQRRGISLPDMEMLGKLDGMGVLNKKTYGAIQQLQQKVSRGFVEDARVIFNTSDSPAVLEKRLDNLLETHFVSDKGTRAAMAGRYSELFKTNGAKNTLDTFLDNTKFIGELPEYHLDLTDDFSRYVHTAGPTYGWSIKHKGMTETYNELIAREAAHMDPIRKNILQRDYLPLVQGKRTPWQIERQMNYNDMKLRYHTALNLPKIKNMFHKMPGGDQVHNFLSETLSSPSGGASPTSISAKITSWMYYSTLGVNPAPAMKNLMQPVITSLNVVGPKATAAGLANLFPKLRSYATELRKSQAEGYSLTRSDEMAMEKVFPKFIREGLGANPQYADMTEMLPKVWATGIRKWVETGKAGAMGMFTATERFNRLLAWESGIAHAGGPAAAGAVDFAANLVRATQFPGGPLGVPRAMLRVPGPLRQFTQFPLRMMDFLALSTRFGSGAIDPATGAVKAARDYGTVGRAMLASTLTYQAAKHVAGVDVSSGLLAGALPAPLWQDAPFYPMPLVPPVAGIAGSLAHAAWTGETEKLPQQLAVAVPGGLAAHRAYKYLSPYRADYSEVQRSGKVALYDRKQKLIGRYSPLQLFARSMGLRTIDQSTESQLGEYLLKQGDILHDYRRQYIAAMVENDMEKAGNVQAEYQRRYPQLGPLQIKKSDIKAVEKAREMTRLQRILNTMGADYKPLFGGIAAMTMAEQTGEDLAQGGGSLSFMP